MSCHANAPEMNTRESNSDVDESETTATKTQNASNTGRSLPLEVGSNTAMDTRRHCDSVSKQNNAISAEPKPALNSSQSACAQGREVAALQSQSQADTPNSAADIASNTKKARRSLRKGKWTVRTTCDKNHSNQ